MDSSTLGKAAMITDYQKPGKQIALLMEVLVMVLENL